MQRPHARRSRSTRVLSLLAALTAALVLLSSCSQLKEQAGNVVEHAIEDAVSGLELTDGLPADFPTSDVPLLDAPAQSATKTGEDGAGKSVVLISAENSGEQARDLLTGAGLEVEQKVSTDAGLLTQLSGNGYDVTLIATDSKVVYVVTAS